jgi:hypothetical protein
MFNPTTAVPLKFYMPSVQAAASTLGVEVNATPVHAKDEIEGVIAAQARDQGSLIVMPDPFNASNREYITLLAARYRVPAMYYRREFVEAGGLIAYANDFGEFPKQRHMSIAFSRVPSLKTSPCKHQPSSILSSTSRPQSRSALTCRSACSSAPMG